MTAPLVRKLPKCNGMDGMTISAVSMMNLFTLSTPKVR